MLRFRTLSYIVLSAALAAVFLSPVAFAAPVAAYKLAAPPLGERWFAILIDNEQVGFYRQQTTRLADGTYRLEGDGSVRMKVMGFTKESSAREIYQISPNLALKTFEVEQTINGTKSRLSGKPAAGGLQIQRETNGKTSVRTVKVRGDLIPGPFLNLVPFFRSTSSGKPLKVQTFDPEEASVKEVIITVLGEGTTPDGQPALKLRNNLYPFVDNDIWVDIKGNTLLESVRDGLVITRSEPAEKLTGFISGMALSKKDLIYDFSLVRINPALKKSPTQLSGLSVAIEGYDLQLPLLENGWQQVERRQDTLVITTGSLRRLSDPGPLTPDASYLQPAEGIEADAPAIKAKADELTAALPDSQAKTKALTAWTAAWLDDSIDDSGSALTGMAKKSGNCQTHAKLYTALARAAGIPTRFVSGLVSQDGSGFLYHSWAESLIDGRWVAVDPTFNQLPADPTHLAFFEGNRLADLAPLVGVIGKIKVTIREER